MNKYITKALNKMIKSPLKVTAQRKSLIEILFKNGDAHFTAEQVHEEVLKEGLRVSLATVYNSLNQFTKHNILKEIKISPEKMYFDTNNGPHHHFYYKETGILEDISLDKIKISELPKIPDGRELQSVEVLITIK